MCCLKRREKAWAPRWCERWSGLPPPQHLDHLELLSSINAEPFYAALGYRSEGCTEHNMRGHPMAAVKMSKRLR